MRKGILLGRYMRFKCKAVNIDGKLKPDRFFTDMLIKKVNSHPLLRILRAI